MTNQNNASAQALASLATAPHEQETGLLNGQLAQGTSCVHEYAFDVKLQAALRVNASTPAHAIAVLEKVMDAAHCNGGMWPNGDPILFEASLAKSIDPVLFEIDGQELEVQGTLDDDSAMFWRFQLRSATPELQVSCTDDRPIHALAARRSPDAGVAAPTRLQSARDGAAARAQPQHHWPRTQA